MRSQGDGTNGDKIQIELGGKARVYIKTTIEPRLSLIKPWCVWENAFLNTRLKRIIFLWKRNTTQIQF